MEHFESYLRRVRDSFMEIDSIRPIWETLEPEEQSDRLFDWRMRGLASMDALEDARPSWTPEERSSVEELLPLIRKHHAWLDELEAKYAPKLHPF
jgi:hypothetical protein